MDIYNSEEFMDIVGEYVQGMEDRLRFELQSYRHMSSLIKNQNVSSFDDLVAEIQTYLESHREDKSVFVDDLYKDIEMIVRLSADELNEDIV